MSTKELNSTRTRIDELVDEAVGHLRVIKRGGDDLTEDYRLVADIFIEMRSMLSTPDGGTDWGGRSYTYRTAVGDAYTKAKIFGEDRARIAANVRHHVSYMLHARLTPEELAEAGIGPASSRDRGRQTQKQRRAIVQAIRNNEVDGIDALKAITAASRLLASVDEEKLSQVDPRFLVRLHETFANAQESWNALVRTYERAEVDERMLEWKAKLAETGVVVHEKPSDRTARVRAVSKVRRNTRPSSTYVNRG